jgi:ATP-dependent RNA helicase DDX5/DBP2
MITSVEQSDVVAKYLKEHEIKVQGLNAPPPALSFEEANIPAEILRHVTRQFDAPTPIQSQALPIAMEGTNMVGIGQTGSGKTLAFLIPALVHILKAQENNRGKEYSGPTALILTPTRELAQQIQDVAIEYRNICNFNLVKCIGGESRYRQLSHYDRKPNLMIATPGRLNDFLQAREMSVSDVEYAVLDEADRMLDMGFEPQIRSILEQTKSDKQVLMFSATWPEDVKEMAEDFLTDYTFLNIGSIELSANKNITQEIVFCDKFDKLNTFLDKVESLDCNKMLVFAETRKSVHFLERALRKRRVNALGIHGDKSQMQRSAVIQKFKAGHCKIMIATDIAARGLDISGVDYVVNYDFPKDIENYIHRIGRTGRSSSTGTSITLFTEEDAGYSKKLVEILKESNQEIPKELYEFISQKREETRMKRYGKQDRSDGGFRRNSFYDNPRQHRNNNNRYGDDRRQSWNDNRDDRRNNWRNREDY